MTQQNAPVLDRHRDEAAKAAGWLTYADMNPKAFAAGSVRTHAQTLANLEAANNRLAEIDRQLGMYSCSACDVARDLASGHTPSPCPGCAAKDEAMEAFKAEVSDAVLSLLSLGWSSQTTHDIQSRLSRFIIPPADPVAEALKAVLAAWHNGDGTLANDDPDCFTAALAELKSRLPLGGAK